MARIGETKEEWLPDVDDDAAAATTVDEVTTSMIELKLKGDSPPPPPTVAASATGPGDSFDVFNSAMLNKLVRGSHPTLIICSSVLEARDVRDIIYKQLLATMIQPKELKRGEERKLGGRSEDDEKEATCTISIVRATCWYNDADINSTPDDSIVIITDDIQDEAFTETIMPMLIKKRITQVYSWSRTAPSLGASGAPWTALATSPVVIPPVFHRSNPHEQAPNCPVCYMSMEEWYDHTYCAKQASEVRKISERTLRQHAAYKAERIKQRIWFELYRTERAKAEKEEALRAMAAADVKRPPAFSSERRISDFVL